jgi:hypothetical protein
VWKKNLSWQATKTRTGEKNKNRSEAGDLKGPGTDCSVNDREDGEINKGEGVEKRV